MQQLLDPLDGELPKLRRHFSDLRHGDTEKAIAFTIVTRSGFAERLRSLRALRVCELPQSALRRHHSCESTAAFAAATSRCFSCNRLIWICRNSRSACSC